MKKSLVIVSLALIALILTSCAAGPNVMANEPGSEGEVAGFWQGLWHGFISFFTFIISLFNDNVSVYEVHNNGGWYNFGFVLAAGLFLSGGILGRKKNKDKK